MEKVIEFIETNIVPLCFKISNQRHLAAIRDGFNGLHSLMIISSLSTLIIVTLNGIINDNLITIFRAICYGSFSFMGLFTCFGTANELYKSYDKNSFEGGFVAVAIFIAVSSKNIDKGIFSVTYLFTAIFIALLSVELLIKVDKLRFIKVKFPSNVPPAVGKTFDSMITPILVVFMFVFFAYIPINALGDLYIGDIITKYIQTPLGNIMDSILGAIFIPLNNSLFWTLGIHGGQSINILTDPILNVLAAENMMLAQQGATQGYNVVTGSFFTAFVWHGGSGSTLGLLIAIAICGKKYRNKHKEMLSNSLWPGLFNINETVIFSAPVVLNPIYAIPFILVPLVNACIGYFAISLGIISPCIVSQIPWVTPPIISGFLATGSLSGAILSGFTLFISVIGYMPFVILGLENKLAKKI